MRSGVKALLEGCIRVKSATNKVLESPGMKIAQSTVGLHLTKGGTHTTIFYCATLLLEQTMENHSFMRR
jgi:hypothetical protein